MNEKELKLTHYELDVRVQETKVHDARVQLDEGYKRLMAEFEREYVLLKNNYERELLRLDRERAYVTFAKDELARGFEG